jgi:hypothetical protein
MTRSLRQARVGSRNQALIHHADQIGIHDRAQPVDVYQELRLTQKRPVLPKPMFLVIEVLPAPKSR